MKKPWSHCFADEFGITHAHPFGTDTQYDYRVKEFAEQCLQLINLYSLHENLTYSVINNI